MNKNYKNDLINYIENIPHGKVTVIIERKKFKTDKVINFAYETLKYRDNDECFNDLKDLVTALSDEKYSGEVSAKLTLKDGNILMMTNINKKETNYGRQ